MKHRAWIGWIGFALATLPAAGPTAAQREAGSRLLLSHFEVDLESAGTTTLFSITNIADTAVDVDATVSSNWGIPVLHTRFTLAAREVLSVDLERWLVAGALPDRELSPGDLEHLQAALSGRRSPETDMFYSKETGPRRASGYVLLETAGGSLIGDAFQVSPGAGNAQGQALANVGPADGAGLCRRHGLRFLSGAFDAGTEIFVWTAARGRPSPDGYFLDEDRVETEVRIFAQSGRPLGARTLELLPADVLRTSDLALPEDFGWLDVVTGEASHVAVRYSARERFSVGLESFCLPEPAATVAEIHLEASVQAAGAAGATSATRIVAGQPVVWQYRVANRGAVVLGGITVSDTHGVEVSCPRDVLEPSVSMICTAFGIAESCHQVHAAVVRGSAPGGADVEDRHTSSYFGAIDAAIEVETETRGPHGGWFDADDPGDPAPSFVVGGNPLERAEWRYRVTNTGGATLYNVLVRNDQGLRVDCPRTRLAVDETMTCTAAGSPGLGLVRHVGEVTAAPAGKCAPVVRDADPSHHRGQAGFQCGLHFETLTAGEDADVPPGPEIPAGQSVTWTFEVINDLFPERTIENLAVSHRQVLPVPGDSRPADCPRSRLEPGEAMTCTATGTAVSGLFRNEGRVTYEIEGVPTPGPHCASFDVSHYTGN